MQRRVTGGDPLAYTVPIIQSETDMPALLLLAAAMPSVPDGRLLRPGATCYVISATKAGVDRPIGNTFQRVRRVKIAGVDALEIVVHQRMTAMAFDMRDALVVRRSDLRPIRLDTSRNGVAHVHLDYAKDRVTGWKRDDKGTEVPIDVTLDAPVWDGNLYGLTFAALPLKAGGAYSVPFYHYDRGLGVFTVTVKDRKAVATPNGPVDAWVIDAGADPKRRSDYYIAAAPRGEIGYRAGPGAQMLGGDCAGID